MELDFTPEQLQIKDAVRRFLSRECPPGLVRKMREERTALPRDIWRPMADLGWLGLPFDESYGGAGGDWVTLAALVEELGRACDPTPFADCVLTCGWLIQDLGSEAQKQRWLPPLIEGKLMLSLATHEEKALRSPGDQPSTLRESATGLRLDGQKGFVENAADSDFLLVSAVMANTGEPCLALIPPHAEGIELIALHSLAHPNLYEVRFRAVSLAPEQLLYRSADLPAHLATAQDRTVAFQSAAAVGGAQRVLEMALDYAKERQQFGKPIGSFQAVQHLLANTWSEVETARLAAYEAITHLEAGLPGAADKVAVAKCASNETFVRTCFTAHQIFGGMGYMWETDLHLWTRKAKEIEMAWGGLYPYRRRLAANL
ncbi:acyl-CoA dehydrogenase family protein [Denitratisoma oestradiolicum]|uniref:Acyl-CoA dehydrogenase n=1 Tax=Denitratisoma oestradiolicum TaxID=311182 RepID=A0A6S6XYF3_9PROT|nr:acyl-CoA dehydrogenase family protein [Denitratisoma oestradiolicum]TWO80106.1 hypothetical protein CBW56_11075 [Denitratisoma oestradiolicum]CAB1370058.1 conserved protein of unknown function [Denitratisoma oestradiolicum]